MAYSQVEVPSSFDFVLMDHSKRERCSAIPSAAFQRNLKELVRDHLCISVSDGEDEDKNSNRSTIQTDEEILETSGENLGASSLVQMWEARLHPAHIRFDRSNSYRNSPTSAVAPAKSDGSRLFSRSSSSKTSPTSVDDFPESKSESARTSGANDDLLDDNEKSKIAGIIKKLKSENSNENEQGSSINGVSLAVNVNSVKIRGRQAFNDLLVQMEQQRKKELHCIADRHCVSKFANRGRIQSTLRVRSLERALSIQNRQREQFLSAQCTTPSHAIKSSHGSTIISHRESSSKGMFEDGTPTSGKERANRIENNKNGKPILHGRIKLNYCEDTCAINQQSTTSNSCKETEKCTMTDCEETIDHISTSCEEKIHNCRANFVAMKRKTNDNYSDCDSLSQISEDHDEDSSARSDVTWQGTESMNNWESNEIIEETNYDWFSEIARPRSYWENLRRGWYEHMLSTTSQDNEIKQLLQRKTVSSFLASDFRAKMDEMIKSHVQIQASHEDDELKEEGQERKGQLIVSFLQGQSHSSAADDANEQYMVQKQQCANPLSAFSSWDYNNHQQVTHDSEHVSQPSEVSVDHDERRTNPSTEMALKGQVEQLQREMGELRKAMQACLEMQSQLLSYVQPEAARKERKCRICHDNQVDTFLYRCGHMCTCERCGDELQQSSGNCPICGSQVVDVVRANLDS